MNIHLVKEGLKDGKRFVRVETRPDGGKEKDRLRPSGFEDEHGYEYFICLTVIDLDDNNGACGGSAILPINILPGRFELEGWEVDTD